MNNVNTKNYWNERFASGGWSAAGSEQTRQYALANVRHIDLDASFSGTILDFGCAVGDAIPVYAEAFPRAQLFGIDFSQAAVAICRKRFDRLARFSNDDHNTITFKDVIVASHVMEHIEGDREIVRALLGKCRVLYVIVPYRETPLYHEHVNFYDEFYYDEVGHCTFKKFVVAYRRRFDAVQWIKDAVRFRFGQKRDFSKEMILFRFERAC